MPFLDVLEAYVRGVCDLEDNEIDVNRPIQDAVQGNTPARLILLDAGGEPDPGAPLRKLVVRAITPITTKTGGLDNARILAGDLVKALHATTDPDSPGLANKELSHGEKYRVFYAQARTAPRFLEPDDDHPARFETEFEFLVG